MPAGVNDEVDYDLPRNVVAAHFKWIVWTGLGYRNRLAVELGGIKDFAPVIQSAGPRRDGDQAAVDTDGAGRRRFERLHKGVGHPELRDVRQHRRAQVS